MDQGLLTADVEEEEYDALNDETFGADLMGGDDWEEDHEKFAELDDKIVTTNQISDDYLYGECAYQHLGNEHYYGVNEHDEDKNIEKSIRQLVLDDEVDDPAIMNIERSRPLPMKQNRHSHYSISPPPPAIVESDHVGSPSTNSIWSRSADQVHPIAKMLNTFEVLKSNIDLQSEDPSIVSSSNNHRLLPRSGVDPGEKLIPNVKTLEEIERDMLLSSQKNKHQSSPRAQTVDEVEREILLKPRVRTVSEIERDFATGQPHGIEIVNRSTVGPPPGFVNCRTGAALAYLGNGNDLANMSSSLTRQMTTSPLPIPGQKLSATPSLLGHLSPSPPLLLSSSMSSPPLRPHSPPPFAHITSPFNSGQVRIQPHTTRMIPPQLTTAYQRHPYLNQVASGQPLLVHGQLGYPPVVRPGSPLTASLIYPHPSHSRYPMTFADPRQVRRFPQPPPHALLQHQQNNQIRARFQPKRGGWNDGLVNQGHQFQNHLRNYSEEVEDEYANLMSQREKDWLVKIQMMQLQSDNPYLDDYYFTTYSLKKRIKEAAKENVQSREPTLVIPERSKVESRSYQPAHFEGSLGKLQVLSVNCPRRMIDLDIVHPDDAESETQKVANLELKRFRQLLLEIEKICSLYLEIDDLDKKAAALPEDARIPLFEHKSDILMKIYNGLVHKGSEHLVQIMSVRKGRHLVARSLPLFSSEQAHYILSCTLGSFSSVLKRDQQDKILLQFLDSFTQVLTKSSFPQTVELGLKLCNHGEDCQFRGSPSPQKSHYFVALQHMAGASIVCNLIGRAEELYLDENDLNTVFKSKWTYVMLHVAEVICNLPDSSLAKPKTVNQLMPHFQRFPIERSKFDVLITKLSLLQVTLEGDSSAK